MLSMGLLFLLTGFTLSDGGLLALGNLFLVAGCFLTLGIQSAKATLLEPSNLKFTLFLLVGIAVVLSGRPRIGILLELIGLYNFMKSFLYTPVALVKSYLGLG
eukprot:jgi/Bigna1/59752/fgenesh1_kg.6_\